MSAIVHYFDLLAHRCVSDRHQTLQTYKAASDWLIVSEILWMCMHHMAGNISFPGNETAV